MDNQQKLRLVSGGSTRRLSLQSNPDSLGLAEGCSYANAPSAAVTQGVQMQAMDLVLRRQRSLEQMHENSDLQSWAASIMGSRMDDLAPPVIPQKPDTWFITGKRKWMRWKRRVRRTPCMRFTKTATQVSHDDTGGGLGAEMHFAWANCRK